MQKASSKIEQTAAITGISKKPHRKIDETPQKPFYDEEEWKFLRKGAASSDFLKDVSDIINCSNLYALKRTCYYDNQNKYCPVQLEISNDDLITFYKHKKVLLQVWDTTGVKNYEKALKDFVQLWKIMGPYLVYKPVEGDKFHQYFHVVNLDHPHFTYKIKEIPFDSESKLVRQYEIVTQIAFYDNLLMVGSHRELQIVELSHFDFEGKLEDPLYKEKNEFIVEEVDPDSIFTVELLYLSRAAHENKSYILHELFLYRENIIMGLEGEDNQLDFVYLRVTEREKGQQSYEIKQTNEVLLRHVRHDPIQNFDFVIKDGRMFGIARRRSNNVDLYRDMMKVESPLVRTQEIYQGFNFCSLKLEGSGEFKSISTDFERYSYSLCKNSKSNNATTLSRCINNINLFSDILCLNQSLFIAHDKTISIYQIQEKKWISHYQYDSQIRKLFKLQNSQKVFRIGIILQDGTIHMLKSRDTIFYESWQFDDQSRSDDEGLNGKGDGGIKVQGQILKIIQDPQSTYLMILTQRGEDDHRLLAFVNAELIDVELDGITIQEIVNYDCFLDLQGVDSLMVGCSEEAQQMDIIELTADQESVTLKFVSTRILSANLQGNFKDVHTALTKDVDKMITFIDNTYMDIFEFPGEDFEGEAYSFEPNILKLVFSDNNFIYCFTQDKKISRCIFSIIDLSGTIQTNELAKYDLYTLELNAHNYLDYDYFNNRFIYFFAFGQVYITPPLHRNNFDFFGMAERNMYVSFKQNKDKFLALDKKNYITTWSSVTGKKYQIEQCNDDLSNYEIFCPEMYSKNYFDKVLMVKKEPVAEFNESEFFERNGFQFLATLKSQVTFNMQRGKQFHEFKLIEIMDEKTVQTHLKFFHPKYESDQYLFFNKSNNIMIEILKGRYQVKALMYEKQMLKDSSNVLCEWKIIRQMDNFPAELLDVSFYPFFFSPEFTYYLDYDPSSAQFIVRHSMTEIHLNWVPKDVINNYEDIRTKAKKILFSDENELTVISREGGDEAIEKRVDIKNGFKDIKSMVIPFFRGSKDHYLVEPDIRDRLDVLNRLQDKYIKLRRLMYVQGSRESAHIYESLFTVNFLSQEREANIKPYIDLSFTYLDWNVMEKLSKGSISTKQVSRAQLTQLIFNILPNCETALHKIWEKSHILTDLLRLSLSEDTSKTIMDIPFLKDFEGKSPLHYCIEKGDQKSINIILKELAGAHFQHHSLEIYDVFPQLVSNPTPAFLDYLDERFVDTYWTKSQKRGALNIAEDKNEAVMASNPWAWEKQYTEELITDEKAELQVKVQFLDLPTLHCYQEDTSIEFFEELEQSDCLEIFQKKSIKSLIEYKYSIAMELTVKMLMIPYLLFLIIFVSYANLINPYKDQSGYAQADAIFKILLLIFSSYFLRNEISQLIQMPEKLQYFLSFWNYLDFVPPTCIVLITLADMLDLKVPSATPVTALVALLMWLKFLYFFRVFQATGYLIFMLSRVMIDMIPFMIVLVIGIAAFGNAFLILSLSNEPGDDRFVEGLVNSIIYVYMLSLGDFDSNFGANYTGLVHFLFLVATLFNLVVMFNLLIAIISETFTVVNQNSEAYTFQVMAAIIAENSYLIPDYKREEHCTRDKYLLFAQNLSEDQQADSSEEKIEEIQEKLSEQGQIIQYLHDSAIKIAEEKKAKRMQASGQLATSQSIRNIKQSSLQP